jgi:hypothetical protein
MKKLSITIALLLGMSITTFASPDGGGLFQRGMVPDEEYFGSRINERPIMPYHELNTNQPASTPLGSGIAVLIGLGAAYLAGKKRKE